MASNKYFNDIDIEDFFNDTFWSQEQHVKANVMEVCVKIYILIIIGTYARRHMRLAKAYAS